MITTKRLPVAEQRRPHERFIRGEGVSKKQIERRGSDDRLDDDLAGAKPVELLAAVEHHLQGANREAQHAEAEPVELLTCIPPGLRQEGGHPEEGKDAD